MEQIKLYTNTVYKDMYVNIILWLAHQDPGPNPTQHQKNAILAYSWALNIQRFKFYK